MSPRPLALLVAVGCNARGELPPSYPCDDAGHAIAARIHGCTGDAAAANAAFHRFQQETECAATGNPDPIDFACSASVSDLDCEAVNALGDDVLGYLTDPSCLTLFGLVADTGGAR